MSRFSRINIIWRKELIDTLRDWRTVVAMVLVPIVLYPVLMVGSLTAVEFQIAYLLRQEYTVAVADEAVQLWLRRLIDTDAARRADRSGPQPGPAAAEGASDAPVLDRRDRPRESARAGVRERPPEFKIFVVPDVERAVESGEYHAGLLMDAAPPPATEGSTRVAVVFDESDIRSEIAANGLHGVLERAADDMLRQRLERRRLTLEFVRPLELRERNIASPQKMAASILGQIVPLILIIMTITGAIYPAIDLTAGERERGTLETLMAAPVPAVDLIAGKFIVVTLIGLTSAVLNLLSVGGTIYLGGVGDVLTRGSEFVFPLWALPWIFVMLVPLAVLFSALLLAVCSFARSFKEAQNYIMPVMIAAMIPGVVGILPGTRLEGPIVIMPVANIVVLTRELFMGRADLLAIAVVTLSTTIYAAAAVAVAARLFGQEAVLFADNASVKVLFQRRFFVPSSAPTVAQALLLAALIYPLNFFIQQQMQRNPGLAGPRFFVYLALLFVTLFVLVPAAAARYARVDLRGALALSAPPPRAWLAAVLAGASTWVLAQGWLVFQQRLVPTPPELLRQFEQVQQWIDALSTPAMVLLLALIPGLCEELFFRGFLLSGLRSSFGRTTAIALTALAFAVFHHNASRLVVTFGLGVLLGIMAVQWRSVWPAVLVHVMHNGLLLIASRDGPWRAWMETLGATPGPDGAPRSPTLVAASVLVLVAVGLSVLPGRRRSAIMPVASQQPAT